MDEPMRVDKLRDGDQMAIIALGITCSQMFKKMDVVVLATDVLGLVHVLPPDSVKLLKPPAVTDNDLDTVSETEAINALLRQGETEERIITYLKSRASREIGKEE